MTALVGIAAPPIDGARDVVGALERAGIACALGGSGLLAALGLARAVRDWDVTTDAPLDRLVGALDGRPFQHVGSDALHADEKLVFPSLALEIIRGFSFFVEGSVVRIPTRVTRRWEGLPVGGPEGWAVAYALLDREEKRDLLLEWLRRNGADRDALDELLAQPLPPWLASELRAIPLRNPPRAS